MAPIPALEAIRVLSPTGRTMIKSNAAIKPQATSSLLSRGAAGAQAVSARHSGLGHSGFRSLEAADLPKTRDVGRRRPMHTSNPRSLLDVKTQKNRPDSSKGSRAGFVLWQARLPGSGQPFVQSAQRRLDLV